MLAACHVVSVMGLDFLLLVLPCTGFLYLCSSLYWLPVYCVNINIDRFTRAYVGGIKSEFKSNARCNNERS